MATDVFIRLNRGFSATRKRKCRKCVVIFLLLFQRILTDDDSVYTSSNRIMFPQINESIRGAMTQLEAFSQTSQTNWLSILKVTLQWIFKNFLKDISRKHV